VIRQDHTHAQLVSGGDTLDTLFLLPMKFSFFPSHPWNLRGIPRNCKERRTTGLMARILCGAGSRIARQRCGLFLLWVRSLSLRQSRPLSALVEQEEEKQKEEKELGDEVEHHGEHHHRDLAGRRV